MGKNEDKAIKRFQLANNKGFVPARIALGTVYQRMSVRPNLDMKLKNYYRKRAIQILLTDKSLPGAIPIDRSEERPLPNP